MEEEASLPPIASHRPIGHAAERRYLREAEAAEEVQVDELGERWLECRELIQCVANLFEVTRFSRGVVGLNLVAIQRDL